YNMQQIKFQKDQSIAKKNDKVTCWYLIQEGSVIQKFGFSEIILKKNDIIGIAAKDIFQCDYIATEDTVLASFVCQSSADLKSLLMKHEKIRSLFLKAALVQRHQILKLYSSLDTNTRQFHSFVESIYDDYRHLCSTYKVDVEPFSKIEHFNSLIMSHKAEAWEINNSDSIIKNYLSDYITLMGKDDSMTVGVIMEAAAQMHRFTLGIMEMESYLTYHKSILLSDSRNDLFTLLFDLSVKVYYKLYDIEPIKKDINLIMKVADRLNIYNKKMLELRFNEFKNYDYDAEFSETSDILTPARKEMDVIGEDCLYHILSYAGYVGEDIERLYEIFTGYRDLKDKNSTEKHVQTIRRNTTAAFYEVYHKVFMHAITDEASIMPDIEMFLNFGFMDSSFIGEENTNALYELSAHIDVCHSKYIFTIYEWLKCIYRGEKEPCKNEFDMDYKSHIADLLKRRNITKEQAEEYLQDNARKVQFEIENMFTSVNKTTYGRVSTFCPVLYGDDLLASIDKMLVTAEKLENAMNTIRKIDYSVFYREVLFTDQAKGITCERIMKEILPDMILMPNAGSRGIMCQETSGIKSDTPGRFMFPIFTMSEVDDLMINVMGAFRWEMCRKIQG
ncbi:MAG: cyclic nucleotide-binding domain-containing protein, partial [Lachnospiraceae bacterium]|nr:cyclic nucleotide-binding domain-containing protein [Lachnospiraceae bacterium]